MTKLKRRKSSKLFSAPRKKSRGKAQRMELVNSGIAVLSLFLIAFIFSFSGRQTQGGVPIEVKFPSMPNVPQLAVDVYDANPVLDLSLIHI